MLTSLDKLNAKIFSEQLNTQFKLHHEGAEPMMLKLVEVKESDPSPKIELFALHFLGATAPRLPQKMFLLEHDKMLAGGYDAEIVYESSAKDLVKACKDIGKEFVYRTPANVKLELMGRKIIGDLLTFFWEGAKSYDVGGDKKRTFAGKITAMLSDNYKQVFQDAREKQLELPIEYLRLQLVTDYVCGMTDSFALNLHKELRL